MYNVPHEVLDNFQELEDEEYRIKFIDPLTTNTFDRAVLSEEKRKGVIIECSPFPTKELFDKILKLSKRLQNYKIGLIAYETFRYMYNYYDGNKHSTTSGIPKCIGNSSGSSLNIQSIYNKPSISIKEINTLFKNK